MTADTGFTPDLELLDRPEEFEMIDGIACPIDPQDALDCESCQ